MKQLRPTSTVVIILLLASLTVVTPTNAAFGAYCSDQLYDVLASGSDYDVVSVLAFMSEQLDVRQFQATHKLSSYSRQASHEMVIQGLQSLAAASQNDLKSVLDAAITSGDVESYEAYWIANAMRIDATKRFIRDLENRSDIEIMIENEPPQSLYYQSNGIAGAGESLHSAETSVGLRVVGADQMWAMGYTGEGRLVGSFDTGVDGDHPALRDSYRGNHGYSAKECWFDPVFGEAYPHYEQLPDFPLFRYAHGTETMGVMVGKDDATGDTTGVAFGAEWISAMVVDVPGANYLQAFQWAADPDGDPNTIDDVPDALNNSWGFKPANLGCLDIFWGVIDNVEAMGTVVIFACGNEGDQGPYTLRNPANRATTDVNAFAVGAINPNDPNLTIWGGSSLGPSDCDSVSIKPEVVAPGESVWTTHVNGTYGYFTGTSFASPHVAGAVALLRQYNPNASVDQIKHALLNSAVDLGPAGEDNTYGHGVIDIPTAMALLPPNNSVNIYLAAVDHDSIVRGNPLPVTVTLKNSGIGTTDVAARIISASDKITVLQDYSEYDNLGMNETATSITPYQLLFDASIPDGALLDIDLKITASGGYQKVVKAYFSVGEKLVKSDFTHKTDSCKFTITNYGTYGLAPNSIVNNSGVGFVYPDTGSNNLYECGLLIGTDSIHVSDGIDNQINSIDDDFNVGFEGNLREMSPGYLGDVETFSRFCDSSAIHPIGVTVEQRTASCNSGDCANYVILEYAIKNDSPDPIDGLYVGIYADWDFPFGSGVFDRTGFSREENVGYEFSDFDSQYRGTAVLNEEGPASFFAVNNREYIYYTGLSSAEKYFFLTAGFVDTASTTSFDQSYCISTGPFHLDPGMSDTAAFAMIGSADLDRLRQAATNAIQTYRAATPVTEEGVVSLPTGFELGQNYPNPFNPETQIGYTVARPGRVTIEVFDLLGRRVAILLDQEQQAGKHLVSWNGNDSGGSAVASGVYFYRMQTDGFSDVKKMLLVK